MSRWRLAPLAVPSVLVAVLGWTHRWIFDDGYIYLRVVRQLQAGNGPVFNFGERVETYTGTLWVAILILGDLVLPLDLAWISVLAGIAGTVAGVALATAGAYRLWRGAETGAEPLVWLPVGSLVVVAVTPTWWWASGGLEMGSTFAWLGACLFVLARWAAPPGGHAVGPAAACLLGLGWLVRPELALASLLFGLLVAAGQVRHQGRRRQLVLLASFAAVPVGYQLVRMAYFGVIVPNTAIAKEGTSGNLGRGWDYLVDFVAPYWLWLPLLAIGIAVLAGPLRPAGRRRTGVVGAFVCFGLANTAYVVAVGGDYLHGRLLLPALFAITAPFAAVPLHRPVHARGIVAPGLAALVTAWAITSMVSLRPTNDAGGFTSNRTLVPLAGAVGRVTLDDIGWGEGGMYRWAPEGGLWTEARLFRYVELDAVPSSDLRLPTVAMWAIGAPGYAMPTDVHGFDQLGLANALVAHFEPLDGLTLAGHEKPLPPAWAAAILTESGEAAFLPETADPQEADAFLEEVAWARAALRCPDVVELRAAVGAAMTLDRAVDNLIGSFDRTRLRIPRDPRTAFRELCGTTEIPPEVRALDGTG